MISRRVAAPQRSLMRGGSAIWMAIRKGHAVVGLDMRKPRRNLVLLEPAVADARGRD
jgi:hypothetical protein